MLPNRGWGKWIVLPCRGWRRWIVLAYRERVGEEVDCVAI